MATDISTITISSTDSGEQKIGRDSDKKLYIVTGSDSLVVKDQWSDMAPTWLEYSNDWGSGYNKREAVAVEAIKSGSSISGYKIAFKTTYKNSSDSPEQVTWDIYQVDASGKLNNGYSASNGQWVQLAVYGVKSIAPYEKDLGQDINGDGVVGINYNKLTLLDTDTSGVKLARDIEQGLYIATGFDANGKVTAATVVSTNLEYTYIYSADNYYKREAVAVVAEKDNGGTVTGYRLATKTTNKSGSNNPEQVTYDVLQFDTSGTQVYSMMPGTQNTDKNIYGMKSLMGFETLFDQDFNGDGTQGINASKLTYLDKDKGGVRLMREDGNKALYYKEGNDIKALPNSGWMEYSNNWGSGSNSREAVAIEATANSSGTTTGYKLAFKITNKNDGQADQTYYEIITLDTSGKQVYGSMVNGVWNETSVYNIKSLTPYEELFNEDFNNDGSIGINISSLTAATADKHGVLLKRDSDKALYIVNEAGNKALALPTDTRLEYNDSYNNGSSTNYNKREALAAEAIKDSAGKVTGFKIALKNSSKYGDNAEQVTYDILTLDTNGKQVNGSFSGGTSGSSSSASGGYATGGTWVDPNTYGAKSIAPFEDFFKDDLNGDNFIGINLNNLEAITTDTTGIRIKRDKTDKGLYLVDESTTPATAVALQNSGWMEYSNKWDNGSNKREAFAAEAVKSGNTITGYKIAFKSTNQYNSDAAQVSYDILAFDTSGKQLYGSMSNNTWTDPNVYGAKSLTPYEKLFDQDFNGDGVKGINVASLTAVKTDTTGVRLMRDADKALYIVDESNKPAELPNSGWMEYSNSWGTDSYNKREVVAIEATKDGNKNITGYKLAIKNTNKWYGNDEQVTYDIQTLDTSGKQVYGSSGSNGMWNDPNVYGAKSLTPYEKLFNEDFNNDGTVGIKISSLTPIATDTQGVRVMRDAEKALYIVNEAGTDAIAMPNLGNMEYKNSWGNGYNSREVVAVEAVKSGGTITGYKLAVKQVYQYDTNPEQVTYDIMALDESGKQVYGSNVNGTWTDPNTYGAKSLTPYEELFNEDFNKDGSIGINVATLVLASTDTSGVKLARDSEQSLYIVNEAGNKAMAITNAGWLEYNNNYSSTNYYKREALAVEAIKDSAGTVTGFKLALKSTSKWDNNDAQVTYDILHLDATGKLQYGTMENGSWKDLSTWGAKSLTPYETLFNQDFNGDGYIGVDVSKLVGLDTDTKGATLARDTDKGLYIVEGTGTQAKAIGITGAGWLEYSNTWGSTNYNKREAIAVESIKDSAGKVTGYKLALRSTNKWDSNPEQVTWDIVQIDATGRMSSGGMMYGSDGNVWGTKSIAPYEKIFNQDLNLDGSIGLDISKLVKVDSDTYGAGLRRDADHGLYIIEGTGSEATATPVGSGWLEYNNSWGTNSYNKREAVAVEAITDSAGTVTGYKLAMKSTNKWDNNAEQITWDIMQLDAEGKVVYGRMDSKTNMWVDQTVWGAKSVASYEDVFGQDLNGDGSIGIDISTLTKVATDTRGVGLRRDRDNALYLINSVNGVDKALAVQSNWLEYDNSWSGNTNKREAVAIEANADGTGYRLAMKQTNSWSGNSDSTWEIMNLDATGKVTWNYNAGNFTTRNARQVEDIVQEDLDGDGNIGVSLADLQLVATDGGNERLAVEKNSKGLYILEGVTLSGSTITAANRKIAVIDSAGTTPQLESQTLWFDGSTSTTVYAVAKQTLDNGDYQYRLAVKVERTNGNTTTTSWQIHTVSKDGVLDWSKVATSNNPDRFESLFNIDFNGDGKVSSSVGTLTSVDTDKVSVYLKKDSFGTFYIVDDKSGADNNGITYITDTKGGSPSFDSTSNGVTTKAYAVNKLDDGSYRLAVKKASTSNGVETVTWEVHSLAKANANYEAAINWSKTKYLSDVKEVESLINQDIDNDNIVGYPTETPTTVQGDLGSVKAATDTKGHLSIEDPALTVSPMAVVDAGGVRTVFESDKTTVDANGHVSRMLKEVVAAESVTADSGYKVLVKSTNSETGKDDDVSFQIYSVSNTGVLSDTSIDTPSILRWESVFKQDLSGDGSDKGVIQSDLKALPNDQDLATDKYGAVYVKNGSDYLAVLDVSGANVTFSQNLSVGGTTYQAKPVSAQAQDNGDILVAVEIDVTADNTTTTSWAVHTLDVNSAGDAADWKSVDYYDSATALTALFQKDLAVVG